MSKLTSSPPPLHAVVLVGALIGLFLATFPSVETLDQDATVQVFTNRIFPEAMSLAALAYIRLAFALFIFTVTIHTTFFGKGWIQVTQYLPNSKLLKTAIHLTGFKTQLPFTSWCWNLLGISFALNAYITFLAASHHHIPPWLLRTALLIFETAAPCSVLVAAVVRYAIWPNIVRNGGDTTELKRTRTLLWHNANVFMALSEVTLMGGLPVHFSHVSVAPLYGIVYVLFSWSMTKNWSVESNGPQFIYFFFDTTLGIFTSIALLVLLMVLMVVFSIFSVSQFILDRLGGAFLGHVVFIMTILVGVCKFND